jgi:hypothetical protein
MYGRPFCFLAQTELKRESASYTTVDIVTYIQGEF